MIKKFNAIFVIFLGYCSLGVVFGQSCNIWNGCNYGAPNCTQFTNSTSTSIQNDRFNNTSNTYSACKNNAACVAHMNPDNLGVSSRFGDVLDMVGLYLPSSCINGSATCQSLSQNVRNMQLALGSIRCLDFQRVNRKVDSDCVIGRDTLHDMTHCCVGPGESLPNLSGIGSGAVPSCDADQYLRDDGNSQKCCLKCVEGSEIMVPGGVCPLGQEIVPNTSDKCCRPKVVACPLLDDGRCGADQLYDQTVPSCCKPKPNSCALPTNVVFSPALSLDMTKCCINTCSCAGSSNAGSSVSCQTIGQKCRINDGTMNPVSFDICTSTTTTTCPDPQVMVNGKCETCNKNPPTKDGPDGKKVCDDGRAPNATGCCPDPVKKDCSTPYAKNHCECGIKLNTVVPFIGDCIQLGVDMTSYDDRTTIVSEITAFPVLMSGLSKITVTLILVFCFLLLIVAGVMMASGGADESNYSQGKKLIGKVIVGIALLGASGVILKLINPSFFG